LQTICPAHLPSSFPVRNVLERIEVPNKNYSSTISRRER